jgi:monothiol glutaredoxin
MWSGWPTFPQIFINGRLVGGSDDLKKLIADGKLASVIAEPRDNEPV